MVAFPSRIARNQNRATKTKTAYADMRNGNANILRFAFDFLSVGVSKGEQQFN